MDMLKRISGVVLVVMAVAVAVQTIVEPLYYTSTEESPYSPVWAVLGWLMRTQGEHGELVTQSHCDHGARAARVPLGLARPVTAGIAIADRGRNRTTSTLTI